MVTLALKSIILAAGQGTRMVSKKPKVLHPVAGVPMVFHALNGVKDLVDGKPLLVVGWGAEQVQDEVGDQADYVLQQDQLGTGHAGLSTGIVWKAKLIGSW